MAPIESDQDKQFDPEPAQFARLRDDADVVCVVGTPDRPAGEYQIEALGNRTVADEHANDDRVSEEDDVVEVVFPSSVNYYAESSIRLSDWTPSQLAGMRAGRNLTETQVTVYAYPVSLLEPTGADAAADGGSQNQVTA